MEIYLTIMTTILVLTQIIRITQNHISLFRQEKKIEKVCGWLRDNDVSEKDFETQREVFRLLHEYLKVCRTCKYCNNNKENEPCNTCELNNEWRFAK